MGISSAGIGSGIDVNSLVTQMMNAERIPLNILKTKQNSYNDKVSAYGKLKSALETFQSSLSSLTATGLSARTAQSSNTNLLEVTAGSTAAPGTYAIQVNALAQEHKLISASITDPAAKRTGDMEISVSGKVVGQISGEYTLEGLVKAINAANAGVSATLFNDGETTRLMVSANNPGETNTISIVASGGLEPFATSSPGTMEILQAAKDASFTVNGLAVTKSSNTISDAISGLTFQLKDAAPETTINVVVAVDKQVPKEAVSGLVSAYNTLSDTIKKMTAYNAATKTGGVLNGDQGANSILTALRSEFTKAVSSDGFKTLSEIGVAFQRDGTLAVDNTKLEKALDTKLDEVVNLFSSETGYATRLKSLTDMMLGSQGIITIRTEGLQNTIKGIVKNQESMEVRLEAMQKRLLAQFTALDTMLSSMQQTSSYLTQQLSSLRSNSDS